MKTLESRINIASIANIIIGVLIMLGTMGLIAVNLSGLLVSVVIAFITIRQQFLMTNDKWILLLAILGGVINAIELVLHDNVFPAINPLYLNIALSVLTIVLRELSKPKP